MAADIGAIRAELATRLSAVTYLDANGNTVNLRAGNIQDQVNPPVILIGPDDPFIDYDLVMQRGADTLRFVGLLLVSRANERTGQNLLDYLMSADRIKTAVETGWPSTNPVIDYAEVTAVTGYGEYTIGEVLYLGCKFPIEVIA